MMARPKPGRFQHYHIICHHRSGMSPSRDGTIMKSNACNTNMEKTRSQITRQLLMVIHLLTTGFLDSASLKANKGGEHGRRSFWKYDVGGSKLSRCIWGQESFSSCILRFFLWGGMHSVKEVLVMGKYT
jgi:hypothetical protein